MSILEPLGQSNSLSQQRVDTNRQEHEELNTPEIQAPLHSLSLNANWLLTAHAIFVTSSSMS